MRLSPHRTYTNEQALEQNETSEGFQSPFCIRSPLLFPQLKTVSSGNNVTKKFPLHSSSYYYFNLLGFLPSTLSIYLYFCLRTVTCQKNEKTHF